MTRTCLLFAAGLTGTAMLSAQEPRQAFQQADTLVAGRGGGGGRGGAAGGMAVPRAEAGKPFSATATSHTTQTLADGTRVSQVTTMLQYRDAEGRVRTETSESSGGSSEGPKQITIRDNVAGTIYFLNPTRETAVRVSAVPGQITTYSLSAEGAGTGRGRGAGTGGGGGGGRGRGSASTVEVAPTGTRPPTEAMAATLQGLVAARGNSNATTEDLGTMNVNGVPATGTRVTTIVPVGAIGNDREFRNVSERWFSSDLNLLIKSVTTDPRFGTTTYELTNISRTPPDSSLFRVPPDYTIPR